MIGSRVRRTARYVREAQIQPDQAKLVGTVEQADQIDGYDAVLVRWDGMPVPFWHRLSQIEPVKE